MGSNKDSDDIRQYLPDLESIRREADPAVAERKLQQALNNPELDRALSEMQQQKPTGQPLFQFPVVPALAKGQAIPPPLPGVAAQQGVVVPQQGATVSQHGAAVPQHGAAVPQGAVMPQRGAITAQHGAAVPLYGAAVPPSLPAVPRGAPQRAPVQQAATAPSQWADRALPPIDKALLPSSLLPVTPPPMATPNPPAGAQATAGRRPWMPTWLMVVLAVFAVSMPFVLAALLLRETPPKEQEPAPPSSEAPARSALPPPAASELSLSPAAPGPPAVSAPGREQVAPEDEPPAPPKTAEPSLDDGAVESEPRASAPPAPARPARAVPRRPQAPAAPAPTEKPLAKELME
ncbi:hypothetical protein [Sorangium sp. So ce1389]|uniref:hypothetical protein n=1 Tax=Sorangium sp. So ce1389 TaxID=3133336 RepID=UPI003F61EB4F